MGEISVREAGRRGGAATAKKHGRKFYEEIGRKGGEATHEKYGPEFYSEIGTKGGKNRGQPKEE